MNSYSYASINWIRFKGSSVSSNREIEISGLRHPLGYANNKGIAALFLGINRH